jgi:trimethylamine--corrinoid protein Co-methyltransferase
MGYEKFILDADQASMAPSMVGGVDLSDNGQAFDALLSNPPGQHFLGNAHTLSNFESAFWRSRTADNNSFEQWLEAGSLEATARANKTWKEMLAEYQAPPLDEGKEQELTEWISRRKDTFPDSNV